MFEILPKGIPVNVENELVQPASIVINDFEELLHLPLSYWKLKDYRKSWLDSIEEGLYNKNHAALAVSMYEPEQTNFIFIWVLYFENNDVYLQNNVLFLEECKGFTPKNINRFVVPRTTYDEDGMKISEWHTNIKDILFFYNSLKN